MEPHPLIIAGDGDPHVDAVAVRLRAKGVAPLCLNKANLVSSGLGTSGASVRIDGEELDRITSIWNRRLLPLVLPNEMEARWRRWCEQEFSEALLGSLYRLDAHWVSDYYAVKKASLKTLQLQVAREEAHFDVPDYVITSDETLARSFIDGVCNGEAVVKPLGRPVVAADDSLSTVFTNRVSTREDFAWADLRYAPCIFQRLIDKVAELRVTVVGSSVFAAKIHVPRDLPHVDYRTVDPYALRHEAVELPEKVSEGCLGMCRYFDLRFAAFDFLLNKEGGIHFLELNPNGQWLWIEELTGHPISLAIADELCRRRAPA